MTADEKYMQVALKLAQRGIGSVEPNPMVGCCLVKSNQIIGKGFHKKFGSAHAEINAFADCKRKGYNPAGATMYVTLEPCCHFGKTPPCTKTIIKSGIKKVVAATKDPTKKVNGKGFKILKKAGIKVVTGICKNEAEELNAAFFCLAREKRPWIIVKWAQSKDGFLARSDKKRPPHRRRVNWITGSKSRKDVHKLRKRVQAVLVGINTVLADNPMLTARPCSGHQPLRVVLDSQLKIPADCKIIRTAKKNPVLIFTAHKNNKKNPVLKKKGAEIIKVQTVAGKCSIKDVLKELAERNIQQILVEGGKEVITSFLRQNLADEIVVYTSAERLAKNGKIVASRPMKRMYDYLKKNHRGEKQFDTDTCLTDFIE